MLFCLALVVIFVSSIIVSIRASGPLVLGSEMNTDGRVRLSAIFSSFSNIWHNPCFNTFRLFLAVPELSIWPEATLKKPI